MDHQLWLLWTLVICSFLANSHAQIWTPQGAKEVKWFTSKLCRDSKGRNGTCITLQHCFVDSRFPHLSGWSEFISGDYDSCAYITDKGVPFVGACCTSRKSTVDTITTTTEIATTTPSTTFLPQFPTLPPFRPGVSPSDPVTIPFPPNPAIPPNWPPALPHPITHPPGFWPPWFSRPTTTIRPKTRPPTRRTTIFPWWRPPTAKTTTEIPIIITEPPLPESELKCGTLREGNRVVGGEKAGYWPWMAGLFGKRGLFCGGSLVSNYHVLTAAHCVYGLSPRDLTIRLGDRDLTTVADYNHIDVKVSSIAVNPSYSTKTNHHDLAIIRLASKVAFNKLILPVCLPGATDSRSFAGKNALVVGWGATRLRGPTSKHLMQGIMRVLSVNECQNKFRTHFPNQIVSTNICAGDNGKDACSGDSGGPLMSYDNQTFTQIGIVSWGVGCGSHNYPGVYTRVTSYIEWIKNNLN